MFDAADGTVPETCVVMPLHNQAEFVVEALESVLSQSYQNFEVVVVDDGSTDDSVERIRPYVGGRVRLLRTQNRGVSAARNLGISYSSSKFVAFIDADDRWAPSKLARHIEHLRSRPDLAVSFSWSRVIDERGQPIGATQAFQATTVDAVTAYRWNPIGNGSSPVVRRTALAQVARSGQVFDEQLCGAEDTELWVRILSLTGQGIAVIPEPLTEYRYRCSSASSDPESQWQQILRFYDAVRGYAPWLDEHRAEASAVACLYLARRAVRGRHRLAALSFVGRAVALSTYPFRVDPMKSLGTVAAALVGVVFPVHLGSRGFQLLCALHGAVSRSLSAGRLTARPSPNDIYTRSEGES